MVGEEGALVQVLTTIDSRIGALHLARAAVEARVAACAQVLGPITSIYWWEGQVEQAEEFLILLKAPSGARDRLAEFVRTNHPYDTPEITTVASLFTDERYLAWAVAETITGRG
jgi:periplasmic divalent cation tolerance protein